LYKNINVKAHHHEAKFYEQAKRKAFNQSTPACWLAATTATTTTTQWWQEQIEAQSVV
jgi:hypothetical protein